MPAKVLIGFDVLEGFEFAKHENLQVIKLGTILGSYSIVKALVEEAGYKVHSEEGETFMHAGRVYDWRMLEAHRVVGAYLEDFANTYMALTKLVQTLNNLANIPVYTLHSVDFFSNKNTATIAAQYSENNRNYFEPDPDGKMPFGINTETPEFAVIVGVPNTTIPVITMYTSPNSPLVISRYDPAMLAVRTSGVAYLALDDTDCFYAPTGADLVNAVIPMDGVETEAEPISHDIIKYLTTRTREELYRIALVVNVYRKKYGTVSAAIFQTIVLTPDAMASTIADFNLDELVNTYFK